MLPTPAVSVPPGFAPLQIETGDMVAAMIVLTGTTRGAGPGTSTPMNEFVQHDDFKSMYSVVQATFAPTQGVFAPLYGAASL